MRVAVLSDIHANPIALERVLAEIRRLAPDELWCLGDTVGYGPDPQICADLIREQADLRLAGNHDLAVAGAIPLEDFNEVAARAARWQQERLKAETLAWLAAAPTRSERADVTLAHGSPRDPVWEYITDKRTAQENSKHFSTQICLVGHSHQAMGWRLKGAGWRGRASTVQRPPGEPLLLEPDHRWILNPGSVGQPRDGDPRASFAILDQEAGLWTWHRLEYDIDAAAAAFAAARLPDILGKRLHMGW